MLTDQFRCLVALDKGRGLDAAAKACGLGPEAFMAVLDEAERTFGRPLVRFAQAFDGFTPFGEIVLTSARRLVELGDAAEPLEREGAQRQLAAMLDRRSVSPKRLGAPGPSPAQLDVILQAALRAPDHGSLHPWRVIEFPAESRAALADVFEQEKRRRDPLACAGDLGLARGHALRPPMLLGFVVSPAARSKVPVQEQWLSAGAALCNLLNAVHRLGFGAIMLSGDRCYDAVLPSQLGVGPDEFLAGFISIGRVVQTPPARQPVGSAQVLSRWHAPAEIDGAADAPPQETPPFRG